MALITICWHWLRPVLPQSASARHGVCPVQQPAPMAEPARACEVCAGLPAPPTAHAVLSPAPAVA
ncbi:MAG: hypothetical protein R3E52_07560 [Burkholderiaceae bacterium]